MSDAARLFTPYVPGPNFGTTWHSYDCICGALWDVRMKASADDAPPPSTNCPCCGKPAKLRARWEADEGGFGSRGQIDATLGHLLADLSRIAAGKMY